MSASLRTGATTCPDQAFVIFKMTTTSFLSFAYHVCVINSCMT